MSYERAAQVLKLALQLQGASFGKSLREIQEEFGVSRRSAERLCDTVEMVFGALEKVPHNTGREKRWRLSSPAVTGMAGVTAEEIALVQRAAQLARREATALEASGLELLYAKLLAAQRPEARARTENDLEALLAADAFTTRPGPRPRIDIGIVRTLRDAIQSYCKLRITYRYRSSGREGWAVVHPYGFLLGHRHYLVAWWEQVKDFRTYALGNFIAVEKLNESFERDPAFSLAGYAKRSFGVFQERPQKVRWRFAPEVAADVLEHEFHPDQKMKRREDGSVVVSFTAGGLKEMAWHLLTWGDRVEVEAPRALRRFWQMTSFAEAKTLLRPDEPFDISR